MGLLKEKLELEIEEAELKAEQKLSTMPKIMIWALALAVIGTIPAYYLARTLSLKYWQGTYQKSLITAKPSFENPADLDISKITLLPLPDGTQSAIVTVTNPNPDLALDHADFRIDFNNANNNVVYSYQDKLFLLPNQKKYLVIPKINSAEKIASFKFDLPEKLPWVKRQNLPQVKLLAGQPQFYLQYDPVAFVAEGNFLNSSPYGLNKVHLVFVAKDFAGEILAVSQRDEFTIKPNERRGYKQLWPGVVLTGVSSVSVYADTDVLDNGNLTLAEQPGGPASDLDRPEVDPYR